MPVNRGFLCIAPPREEWLHDRARDSSPTRTYNVRGDVAMKPRTLILRTAGTNCDEPRDSGVVNGANAGDWAWLAAVSAATPGFATGLQQECEVCILPPQSPAICAQHFISAGVSARCGSRQASAGSAPQRTRRSATPKMRATRIGLV